MFILLPHSQMERKQNGVGLLGRAMIALRTTSKKVSERGAAEVKAQVSADDIPSFKTYIKFNIF